MLFAITFISLALCLYSLAIWSERFSKKLKLWMLITFAAAFSCDLAGTSLMFFRATSKFQLSFHSFCGYAALLIMGLHLIWAISTIKHRGRWELYFHRFSIWAWFIWLSAFLSGIPRA